MYHQAKSKTSGSHNPCQNISHIPLPGLTSPNQQDIIRLMQTIHPASTRSALIAPQIYKENNAPNTLPVRNASIHSSPGKPRTQLAQ